MPHPRLRRLLVPALAAVLALAVAVPVTWVAARAGPAPPPALPPVPTGPQSLDELREELLAQLPGGEVEGAVLLEMRRRNESGTATGLPPARYQIHLICGVMRRQGTMMEASIVLATSQDRWVVELPCPSTPLSPAEELDFTGATAGAVWAFWDYEEESAGSFVLLLRLVPVPEGLGDPDA